MDNRDVMVPRGACLLQERLYESLIGRYFSTATFLSRKQDNYDGWDRAPGVMTSGKGRGHGTQHKAKCGPAEGPRQVSLSNSDRQGIQDQAGVSSEICL